MKNIITYVKKMGNERINERGFNDVDSLVLSQLSYLIYDGLIPTIKAGSFTNFSKLNTANNIKKLTDDTLEPKKNIKLLKTVFASQRFSQLKIGLYEENFDKETVTQFAAMTFIIDDYITYIAFRGTDISLLGWKEDFNMAIMDEVPGQKQSTSYLNKIANNFFNTNLLIIGGHSKGGNLALCSALNCTKINQDKIAAVYDHEGPGFKKDIFTEENFIRLKDRVFKTIPKDSVIGILMIHYSQPKIIKSQALFGLLQHDPFAWVVKNGNFQTSKKTTLSSQSLEKTLEELLKQIDEEERKSIINDLFLLFEENEIANVTEFKTNCFAKLKKISTSFKKLPKNDQKRLKHLLSQMLKLYIKHLLFHKKLVA